MNTEVKHLKHESRKGEKFEVNVEETYGLRRKIVTFCFSFRVFAYCAITICNPNSIKALRSYFSRIKYH